MESYRQLERTHKRWQTMRSRFDLTIEDAAFFIGRDESLAPTAWERQARKYFAAVLDYDRLEQTNDLLRAHRLRQGLSLGEAAFLFAGIEDTDPRPNKLRAARLRTGLSQKDVAYIIDKPRHMLSCYERGKREPDLVTAMSLSTLYDLPLNKLFPQQVGVLNLRLKKRERMLAVWRRMHLADLAA
jgi:DNA-binding XRE family transcriptional regulator